MDLDGPTAVFPPELLAAAVPLVPVFRRGRPFFDAELPLAELAAANPAIKNTIVLTHAPLPPEGLWSSPADMRAWPFHWRGIEAEVALRLARFNVNIGVVDKRYFQGLPSPMAAAFVAGLVWVFDDLGIDRELWLSVIAWLWFASVKHVKKKRKLVTALLKTSNVVWI